jgi:Spy/CpxP family protein refolding chaperone
MSGEDMKTRLAAPWLALLLMAPPSWAGGQAQPQPQPQPQPGPGAGHRGNGPMMGRDHGMGGMGGMGMMGGWGGGMMGPGWGALDLTKDQRNKAYAIHRDLREKQFALMDRMHDNMESVSFYRNGKFDEQAARNFYAGVEKIHRQMFENMLDAQKRADALLTPQQRQQLSQAPQ